MIDKLTHLALHKLAEETLEHVTNSSDAISPEHGKKRKLMQTSPVCRYFYYNLANWLGMQCENDCVTYLDDGLSKGKLERLGCFRKAFDISSEELILFTRDTSFWSNCDQGVVFTDQAIYVIKDNENPQKKLIIKWNTIETVVWSGVFKIMGKNEVVITELKRSELFKLEPNSTICSQLASHLTKMAYQTQV